MRFVPLSINFDQFNKEYCFCLFIIIFVIEFWVSYVMDRFNKEHCFCLFVIIFVIEFWVSYVIAY